MPPAFRRFWALDVAGDGSLTPLSDGPGEQALPVVFATASGAHAMGVYSPDRPPPGYGRFRFEAEQVNKWNCVFRVRDPNGRSLLRPLPLPDVSSSSGRSTTSATPSLASPMNPLNAGDGK